jgi:lipoprotein NlpI
MRPLIVAVLIVVAAPLLHADDKTPAPPKKRTPEKILAEHQEALRRSKKLAAEAAVAFDMRGAEHFKKGRFKESVADFDRAVELDPKRKPWHWQRGISYYYTGQFVEGQKQFEGYQTVDDNDVENAAWRYLCMARKHGVEKARKTILKIGDDRRVPMRQIYELYAGRMKPDDVLTATTGGKPSPRELSHRLFYAHLYLGLYWEVNGKKDLAKKHLIIAADEHRIGHYMWDVAHVHANLYREKSSDPKDKKKSD